jgi:hypothetical protein
MSHWAGNDPIGTTTTIFVLQTGETRMNKWATSGLLLVLLATSGCIAKINDAHEDEATAYSVNFTFSMRNASVNDNVASVQYDVPGITPSVVDDGAVLLFFREQGTWTAMPYTFAFESPDLPAVDYTVNLGFGYEEQFIEVFYEASTNQVDLTDMPDRQIKAVIINSAPPAKMGIDLTDYEAVRQYFGLAD